MSMTAIVNSLTVSIMEGTLDIKDTVDARTTVSFTVYDPSGLLTFQKGQPVTIADTPIGTFTGYVNNPTASCLPPNINRIWAIDCVDRLWDLDRIDSDKLYSNQYSGTIVADQVQRYGSAEGVSGAFALDWDELQTDWAGGTLSGTVATINASDGNPGDGDLELSLAGTQVVITESVQADFATGTLQGTTAQTSGLQSSMTPALKLETTCNVPGGGNAYTYIQIWAGSYTIVNSRFVYDLWIDPSSPQAMMAVDFVCTDGTTLRDTNNGNDFQSMPSHPNTDMSGLATGQWYSRSFPCGNMAGKTLQYVTIASEGDNVGTYTCYVRNIHFTSLTGSVLQTFFTTALNVSPAKQLQNNGYYNTTVSVVNTYEKSSEFMTHSQGTSGQYLAPEPGAEDTSPYRLSPAYSIDAAKILKSSSVSWIATLPADTNVPSTATQAPKINTAVFVRVSYDGGLTFLDCTNNAPLPNLPAGISVAGKSLIFQEIIANAGNDPTITSTLQSLQVVIKPSYTATKNDLIATYGDASDWASGTFTNTISNGTFFVQFPSPAVFPTTSQNWSGSLPSQTLFGNNSPTQGITSGRFWVKTNASQAVTSRLDFAGANLQNFTAQVDISVDNANTGYGLVYRTSGWQNNDMTFGYSVEVSSTYIHLSYGTNSSSGAGSATQIASATISLTLGTTHTLKIVVNGEVHSLYLDGTLALTVIDYQWLGVGYLGLREWTSTNTSQQAFFDNFSVTPMASVLTLDGYTRNWDDSDYNYQTQYGGSGAGQVTNNKRLALSSDANFDVRGKMVTAGQRQNFTTELDCYVNLANIKYGFTYRTTGWQNLDGTCAYEIELTTTTLKLYRGSNTSSGGASVTQVGSTATLALTTGNWHRLKAIVNGNSHQIYLDDVLYITATDSTYPNAGFLGIRMSNSASGNQTGLFDNFGVVAALTGTWLSPTILLTSVGTCGGSFVAWRQLVTPDPTTTILVEATINGGSTWTTVANGGAISQLTNGLALSGVNLQIRITLTSTNATALPIVGGLTVIVLSSYSSSGTRVSPSLSLSPVGRAATALVNWNAITPTNTTVVVDTTLDGGSTYQNVSTPGGAIGNITTQPALVSDTYDTNTSANYTQANYTGGTVGTWVWNTASSRLELINPSSITSSITSTGFSSANVVLTADCDQADFSGMIVCYSSASAFYRVRISDASGTHGETNALVLVKRVSGTDTVIAGTSGNITFPRGTPHRIVLSVIGSNALVYFDGVLIINGAAAGALSAGSWGFIAGQGCHFYNVWAQAQGDDVTAKSLKTRITLSTTDATVTPQMLDMQAFVAGATIGKGVLIPSADYRKTFVSANIADLTKKANYWSNVDGAQHVLYQARNATLAPWPIASKNSQPILGQNIGDVLIQNLSLQYSGDLYRNRQILRNVNAMSTFNEIKFGDGTTRTWNVSHPLTAAPAIVLNNVGQTVGVKGVDTGRNFYYQIGGMAIDQDASGRVLGDSDSFTIAYTGSFTTDLTYDNTGAYTGTVSQSQMQTIMGSGTGIVVAIEDVSSQNMDVATANVYGSALLQRYGTIGRIVTFVTTHAGLAIGQQIAVFIPEQACNDVQMLITSVDIKEKTLGTGSLLYYFTVTATEGPALGNWVRLFANVFNAT